MRHGIAFLAVVLVAAVLTCVAAPLAVSSAPRIVKANYRLSFVSSPVARTYITTRLLVREDSGGRLRLRVRERQPLYDWTHYRAFRRRAPRYYGLTVRWYNLKWPAPATFWGGGYYKIRITVGDSEGLVSNAVFHQWNIGD